MDLILLLLEEYGIFLWLIHDDVLYRSRQWLGHYSPLCELSLEFALELVDAEEVILVLKQIVLLEKP